MDLNEVSEYFVWNKFVNLSFIADVDRIKRNELNRQISSSFDYPVEHENPIYIHPI